MDEFDDETEVNNLDLRIFNVLKSLFQSSTDSAQEYSQSSQTLIQITTFDQWQYNQLPKIIQLNTLINDLMQETYTKCKELKQCKSFEILRLNYDIINNDILSKFVDIDALIDDHGNDIANLESSVLPYLSTNKNRMLKQLTS